MGVGSEVPADLAAFRLGSILNRSLRIYLRNVTAFVLIAAVMITPTYFYYIWVRFGLGILPHSSPSEIDRVILLLGAIAPFVEFLMGLVATAAITYGTIKALRGQTVGFGKALAKGLPLVLAAVPVALVATIIVGLGLVFLVVPGLIFAVLFWVAVPVVVVEGLPPKEALARSWHLSSGYRWPIFWLLLMSLASENGLARAVDLMMDYQASFLRALFVKWMSAALLAAFWAVVMAVSYHDLRQVQEGKGVNRIAAVFD